MKENQAFFVPRDSLSHALRYWWLLVILAILGAGSGQLFHKLTPPLYESRAILSVSIDFTRSGYLNDIEQDKIIGMVGDLISSSMTRDRITSSALVDQIITEDQRIDDFVQVERWGFKWAIRAQHPEPRKAADIANLWAGIAMDNLEVAYSHAIQAELIDRQLVSLQSCLQYLTVAEPVHGLCRPENLVFIQSGFNDLSEKLLIERRLSQGISPSVQFSWTERATIPDKPVRFGENLVTFSGAILGLIAGMVLLQILFIREGTGKEKGDEPYH